MFLGGGGDGRDFAGAEGVGAAHGALELGELVDHLAGEVGLGELRGALGEVGVVSNLPREPRRSAARVVGIALNLTHGYARAMNDEILQRLQLVDAVPHRGESGRAREKRFRDFLRRLVPSDIGIDTGFIIDSR